MRKFLLLILVPIFLFGGRPDFKDGVSLYNQGAYWEALRIFAELADEEVSLNPQRSASSFMRIKCYNKLGFSQRALMLARDFPQAYSGSQYMDDLQFLIGEIHLDLGDARESAWYFASSAISTKDKKIRKAAREYTESLVGNACDVDDLHALAGRSIDRTGQYIALLVAERFLKEGDRGEAISILFNMRPYIKDEDLRKKAISLYDRFSSNQSDTLHVAVVLPLTGPLGTIGNSILDGVKFSAMTFMDSTDYGVDLHIFDNESKLSETIRIAREVRDDPRLIAQIGPLTNENVKGTAAVLEGHSIPIIAPTATENHLTNLSKGIFQFRSTRERKAIAMAEYAVQTLGLQTFAIIAPSTEYGQQFADNFAVRVDELGGIIQYQGWYVGEPTDLSKVHFRRIREQGLEELYIKFQADSLRLDSLLIGLITEGDSVNVYEEMLKPIFRKSKPTRGDSLGVELSHIDGIFFPIHEGNMRYILYQLASNNLTTHILGDENWLDRDILKKDASYISDLTLVAGDRLGFQTISQSFSNEFVRIFKHRPDQYDYMGFDVMGMLLESAQYAGRSGSQLWEVMINSPNYEGLVHQVQWGGDTRRENDLVFLMDYVENAFELTGYYDNSGFFSMDTLEVDSTSEIE
ncbi:MAG: ABC transporter substrate-binding protein [Candidatus Marinimicrobia bacterium]|jgi:ABC-type branched-subunit amino acid transport system substrate-binding protein|nr:ABC transporter substrate-binding protein [Candidatus Neomarinimicrobiota bacterium]MBT3630593.1 ABC transporter substrate-binding protein [Candidatus Neomarinimicrobiota bacterium]MBT3825308.1 ABC transporter substrate-binding protein [Candidatus Neomarinimicrobiota bacterium]MBT4129460.1 ABC transporter substrate-binding protein [Candidatus Neomarinimicrobiota bacterium]MBT4295743.1 ABC transporter substrate-binding protein [Candidatus Neomarinimicrobiota bacterium]